MASKMKRKKGPTDAMAPAKRTKSERGNNCEEPPKNNIRPSTNSYLETEQANGSNAQSAIQDQGTASNLQVPQKSTNLEGTHSSFAKSRLAQPWKLSTSIGGRMITSDPVFTPDERHLIVATRTTIQVYTTADSLLARSIRLKLDSSLLSSTQIVTTCLSPSNADMIWVACSNGSVFSVNWTNGSGADSFWTVSSTGCIHMTVASMESHGRKRDVVFTTEARKEGGFRTTANELAEPDGTIAIAARTIYTSQEPIQFLKATRDGSIIVGASGKRILVGRLRSTEFNTVDKIKFEFRTFESNEFITSLDLKVSLQNEVEVTRKDKLQKTPVVDLVVGNIKGVIFVHYNIAGELFGQSKNGLLLSTTNLVPPRLHWHRQAVNSIKWSLDGGKETVLVLWQLESGKKDFLPHMSATIENIAVSPKGSSYAIQLSDNSTIVLSTADLLPKMMIAGIQASVIQPPKFPGSNVLRAEATPSHLLLAVGPQQEVRDFNPLVMSNSYLQTFDLGTGQSVSNQALTRTNVTNVNAAPNSHNISEPRVTHLKVSSDGEWLATVDEWTPSANDLEFVGTGVKSISTEINHRREVFLKFWKRNSSRNTWELVSRIDSPHLTDEVSSDSGRILDLASDPSSSRFATIGVDGSVKIWCTRLRKRDGVLVRGKDSKVLKNWGCSQAFKIGKTNLLEKKDQEPRLPNTGCVSFCEDGSVLAAALGSKNCLINLIDSYTGSIKKTFAELFEPEIFGIEFLGQDLIILSDKLVSFDIVSEEIRHTYKLRSSILNLSVDQKREMMHLAVDQKSKTFAISLPKLPTGTADQLIGARSELVVFHQDTREPQLSDFSPTLITALSPASMAPLQSDRCGEDPISQPVASQDEEELEEIELVDDSTTATMVLDSSADEPREYPVVTKHQLSEVFDIGPAFALPPMEEMFYRVTNLFAAPRMVQTVR
ncbi:WD domain-containing protein [Blumeria hordei DH14]|uniref:WD domain-containing protein n=1 Tax=Blumeria graminis f. sp. hordei (strain DH14) TaxID=546991 RepID=N1JBZ7_BLUG1|nr:WD domain-containing protein [Blumeria hordei DH14]